VLKLSLGKIRTPCSQYCEWQPECFAAWWLHHGTPSQASASPAAASFTLWAVVLLEPLGNASLAVTTLGHQVTTFVDENRVAVLGRIDGGWNKKLAVLAWSALLATSGRLGIGCAPAACQTSAGPPPAEADDASPPCLDDLCGGAIGATPMSCSVPATEDKACIS